METEDTDLWHFLTEAEKVKGDLNLVIERDKWCKDHISDFSFYCKSVDSTYKLKTIFLTNNTQAYKYLYETDSFQISMMDALDIIDNPMSVFDP